MPAVQPISAAEQAAVGEEKKAFELKQGIKSQANGGHGEEAPRQKHVANGAAEEKQRNEEEVKQQTDVGKGTRKLKLLASNDQIRELQTVLRDKTTVRSDFIFYADRLIRLVVEEGLNQLPFDECTVTTPSGGVYEGLKFRRGICGVSIVRSGEAMEKGLRECCRSIRIGKILIKNDEETHEPKVCYARFPPDIQERKVLLMYPLLNSGATLIAGLTLLFDHGVEEENIIILTLFATAQGVENVLGSHPGVTLLTTEIHDDVVIRFGKKYFGTD